VQKNEQTKKQTNRWVRLCCNANVTFDQAPVHKMEPSPEYWTLLLPVPATSFPVTLFVSHVLSLPYCKGLPVLCRSVLPFYFDYYCYDHCFAFRLTLLDCCFFLFVCFLDLSAFGLFHLFFDQCLWPDYECRLLFGFYALIRHAYGFPSAYIFTAK